MKRHGNLWPLVTGFPNLLAAAEKAKRGKMKRENVARFHLDLERNLWELHDELCSKTYTPGGYETFYIYEPKPRLISAAPYRDRVVHHALCRVLETVFEPTFIEDSYACRRGKGTHAAIDRFTEFARRNRYVLKCDIRKFFPSTDHEILRSVIASKIKDPDVLWLVGTIIDHSNPQEPVWQWFPGDDLLTRGERRRGVPIGNQTSQFFGNVVLSPFDHFVKETLRARYYVRYVDDFVIFSDDKAWLHEVRAACREFLGGYRLKLHPGKSVISRVCDGTKFLGYRIFPYHRLLAKENVKRMRRRLKHMQENYAAGELDAKQVRQRLQSWIGHASHANTLRLRKRLLYGTTFSRRQA